MTEFFTSDTHFGHGGALGLFGRPFAGTAAMDEALIERWNQRVGPGDVVWHLGDFAYRASAGRVEELLARLHGQKHLLTGNLDGASTSGASGWSSVSPYLEMARDGVEIVLCHYPFRSWNRQGKGAFNLHGHSHGRLKALARQVDVGVDVFDHRPVTLAEIRAAAGRGRTQNS